MSLENAERTKKYSDQQEVLILDLQNIFGCPRENIISSLNKTADHYKK